MKLRGKKNAWRRHKIFLSSIQTQFKFWKILMLTVKNETLKSRWPNWYYTIMELCPKVEDQSKWAIQIYSNDGWRLDTWCSLTRGSVACEWWCQAEAFHSSQAAGDSATPTELWGFPWGCKAVKWNSFLWQHIREKEGETLKSCYNGTAARLNTKIEKTWRGIMWRHQ